jgi:type II secretory ATPase GspE/PulE/Tfp pilus assembly ATPase PilB-like protein
MIGEIRDEETQNIAFKAALTGHMVFSTLHTTDTIETISRLREMGLPNYIISAALKGVVSQRLARKICSECNGAGCDKCNYNGLKGRIGLFEVLEIGENIASNILNNCSINNIKNNLINNGFCTIIDDALIKNKDNIINKDEILRVFGTYG